MNRPVPIGVVRRGYTLIETIVSLTIVSLIALGIAAILQTAAYGTASQRELRRTVVRGEQVYARIEDAIRDSRAVLAAGSGYLVLWTGDTNANDQVNRSELLLVELPGGSNTLTAFTGRYTAGDPAYPAGSNFYTTAQSAKSSGYFPAVTWAGSISALTFTLDNATPAMARLVNWSLTLTDQQNSRTVTGSAALRAAGQFK